MASPTHAKLAVKANELVKFLTSSKAITAFRLKKWDVG